MYVKHIYTTVHDMNYSATCKFQLKSCWQVATKIIKQIDWIYSQDTEQNSNNVNSRQCEHQTN